MATPTMKPMTTVMPKLNGMPVLARTNWMVMRSNSPLVLAPSPVRASMRRASSTGDAPAAGSTTTNDISRRSGGEYCMAREYRV